MDDYNSSDNDSPPPLIHSSSEDDDRRDIPSLDSSTSSSDGESKPRSIPPYFSLPENDSDDPDYSDEEDEGFSFTDADKFNRFIRQALEELQRGNGALLSALQMKYGHQEQFQSSFKQAADSIQHEFERKKIDRLKEKPKTKSKKKKHAPAAYVAPVEYEVADIKAVLSDELIAAKAAQEEKRRQEAEAERLSKEGPESSNDCCRDGCFNVVKLSMPRWEANCTEGHRNYYCAICQKSGHVRIQRQLGMPVNCTLKDCEGYLTSMSMFRVHKKAIKCVETVEFTVPDDSTPDEQVDDEESKPMVVVDDTMEKTQVVEEEKPRAKAPAASTRLQASVFNPNLEQTIAADLAAKPAAPMTENLPIPPPPPTRRLDAAAELQSNLFQHAPIRGQGRSSHLRYENPSKQQQFTSARRPRTTNRSATAASPGYRPQPVLTKNQRKKQRAEKRRKTLSMFVEQLDDSNECAVCLEPLELNSERDIIFGQCRCYRLYHEECLLKAVKAYLGRKVIECPLCRTKYPETEICRLSDVKQALSPRTKTRLERVTVVFAESKWTCTKCSEQHTDVPTYARLLNASFIDECRTKCTNCRQLVTLSVELS